MKFKIGDRVAIYGTTGNFKLKRCVGTIEEITVEGLLRFDAEAEPKVAKKYDRDTGGWDFTLVHPKQCRRLRPRKRIWVFFPQNDELLPSIHKSVESAHRAHGDDIGDDLVEFLEVSKK